MSTLRALIAEDEPILALTLKKHLEKLWPELQIIALAENGVEAVQLALEQQPDIIFLDIKMPGKTGLEVAEELADAWPDQQSFPRIVFVTAYDEFAVQAFEHSASDYVLKPVSEERLSRTVSRLQKQCAPEAGSTSPASTANAPALDQLITQLQNLLPAAQLQGLPAVAEKAEPLRVIRAAVGNNIRMIPVEDVLYFEATDKYINVVTREHESLIRCSLRDLLPQLDASLFWQIHRSTVVNIREVSLAQRDEAGKITLRLRNSEAKLPVSRVYAHLFRQM
ncbi:LytR/AlgR family response regulator transcription factor [Undibacterium luofuense]|uniref:Response regulator transcription factor n=1 Tax=Undibacterium luofuense TaxID=2828733 RepID=A0A941I7W2_9BURK|nr:LytTR family DNA-binding domain-containing protein [Undibacterium luofuense]MBR7783249.1 response regulator transcription factor [Undibacterium luofuense]